MSSSDKGKPKDKTIEFQTEENTEYDKVTKELGFDNENQSDLEVVNMPKELDEDKLQELVDDPRNKALVREPNNNPIIEDTLDDNEQLPSFDNKTIKKMREDAVEHKNNLVVFLGSKETIKLHISKGRLNGKKVWITKEFWFNSIDKREDFKLKVLKARMDSLNYKNNNIGAKLVKDTTDEEKDFLFKAPLMVEIAGYRVQEYEANLRLGMTADDFGGVDMDEYALALLALGWRSINVPYSNAKQ